MQYIRSFTFDLILYISLALVLILGFPCSLVSRKMTNWMYPTVGRWTLFLLKRIVGLDVHIEGIESIPPGPVIFACKHQSTWETLILGKVLNNPAVVLKRELNWIPLLNRFIKHQQAISIARGKSDLKSMIRQGQNLISSGRSLLIFPEGTRHVPGKKVKYHRGVEKFYEALNVPVVPIALNSGTFWPRRGVLKKPGLITLRFLDAIPPGHPTFMAELEARIETSCQDIALTPLAKPKV